MTWPEEIWTIWPFTDTAFIHYVDDFMLIKLHKQEVCHGGGLNETSVFQRDYTPCGVSRAYCIWERLKFQQPGLCWNIPCRVTHNDCLLHLLPWKGSSLAGWLGVLGTIPPWPVSWTMNERLLGTKPRARGVPAAMQTGPPWAPVICGAYSVAFVTSPSQKLTKQGPWGSRARPCHLQQKSM